MASSSQHEPTMEEILASIRKIISEDSNEAPASAEPASPEPAKPDADVLELTQEVHEDPVTPPPAPPPVAEHASQPAHAAHEAEPEQAPEPDVVFVSHEETTVSSSDHDDDSIFSEKSRQAIDDAFAGLDDVEDEPAAQAPRSAAMPAVEGDSVEAVFERAVRSSVDPLLHQWMDGRKDELLSAVKPMIREWMDEHFPALLEGAVRDEVARVVKARGRR